MAVILFVLSFLVLTLEVLETKIFAYSLANHQIFLVVGVVLLGFGAGGTALSLKRKLEAPRPLVDGVSEFLPETLLGLVRRQLQEVEAGRCRGETLNVLPKRIDRRD